LVQVYHDCPWISEKEKATISDRRKGKRTHEKQEITTKIPQNETLTIQSFEGETGEEREGKGLRMRRG